MAFIVFDYVASDAKSTLRLTPDSYRLAGYNLIYAAWKMQGSPLDTGWHASADDLIHLRFSNKHSYKTKRLLIDFDPKSTKRIGLIELLDVYAYTWKGDSGEPAWTPLMLRMRDVFYKDDYDQPIDQGYKKMVFENICEPNSDATDFVEFLYLNGSQYGWNWGRNGMTNAAFLSGAAREYFRRFF